LFNSKIKILLILSLLVNLVLACTVLLFVQKIGGVNYVKSFLNIPYGENYKDNPIYTERTTLFNELEIPKNSTVFIGDSITQRSLFNEMFDSKEFVNRGVESDTTLGVLNRLDAVVKAKPKKIFILVGINDLIRNQNIETVSKNYSAILKKIKNGTPNTEVYVQSVLPVNESLSGGAADNKDINELNRKLLKLSDKYGYQFIDINSKVAKNGQLPSDYTVDGIHLKGEAYVVWKTQIKPYIED
jgi:lysophospholipase L1-like esterase